MGVLLLHNALTCSAGLSHVSVMVGSAVLKSERIGLEGNAARQRMDSCLGLESRVLDGMRKWGWEAGA